MAAHFPLPTAHCLMQLFIWVTHTMGGKGLFKLLGAGPGLLVAANISADVTLNCEMADFYYTSFSRLINHIVNWRRQIEKFTYDMTLIV